MLHLLKVNAKPVLKGIAQITNVAALAVGSLQATGVIALLEPKLNISITLGIILLNMLAHWLKTYAEPTPVATIVPPANKT